MANFITDLIKKRNDKVTKATLLAKQRRKNLKKEGAKTLIDKKKFKAFQKAFKGE